MGWFIQKLFSWTREISSLCFSFLSLSRWKKNDPSLLSVCLSLSSFVLLPDPEPIYSWMKSITGTWMRLDSVWINEWNPERVNELATSPSPIPSPIIHSEESETWMRLPSMYRLKNHHHLIQEREEKRLNRYVPSLHSWTEPEPYSSSKCFKERLNKWKKD